MLTLVAEIDRVPFAEILAHKPLHKFGQLINRTRLGTRSQLSLLHDLGGQQQLNLPAFNGLPRFYHPVFRSPRFSRVTDDRFFLAVDAEDPRFDESETREFLESLGGSHLEVVDE